MRFVSSVLLLSIVCLTYAGEVGYPLPPQAGFTQTSGGTEGRVIAVTNLNASGRGSLRAAVNATGPRLVVFKVGGVIDLDKNNIVIREPWLTIAGQTAPSPGITLIRGGISIETHDVIIQHLRVRPGDVGEAKRSGWEVDAITTYGPNAHDIIIDHCSLTWSTDENLSASGSRFDGPSGTSRRVTFSNNLIAEALDDSTHPNGPHSKGSLIHDFCREIAVIGNLYAHNYERNPYFKSHTTGVIVNNVIYNPATHAIQLGYAPLQFFEFNPRPQPARVSIVGNILIYGPDTRLSPPVPLVRRVGQAYLEDNRIIGRQPEGGVSRYLITRRARGRSYLRQPPRARIRTMAVCRLDEKPLWPEGLFAVSAETLFEPLVANVGARPWDRDAIDSRIIESVVSGGGRIIDSQDEVGGYPVVPPTRHEIVVPDHNRSEWLRSLTEIPAGEVPHAAQ